MRQILRDPCLQAELMDVGYVLVDLLDEREVTGLRSALTLLKPDDRFEPMGDGPYNYSTYHCTFLDTNTEYKRQANEQLRNSFERQIDHYVADYRILTSNIYVKPPNRGRFQIHQNWPTLGDLSATTLTAWCPLQDCSAANATLHVVPGSHKLTPDVATASEPPFFNRFEDHLIDKYLVPVDVQAGQAVLFDDSLIHWSPENKSDSPRWAIQIELVPVDDSPVLYHLTNSGRQPLWELFRVEPDFFVEHPISEIVCRPSDLQSIGFRPYRNRQLDEREFALLIERGPRIRSAVYESGEWPI